MLTTVLCNIDFCNKHRKSRGNFIPRHETFGLLLVAKCTTKMCSIATGGCQIFGPLNQVKHLVFMKTVDC